MSIRNPEYIPLLAGGAITPNRIVKMGTADQAGVLAAAATDLRILGISVANVTAASAETFDVCVKGEYELIAGGPITRGDPVTSDAAGAGVAAAPAGGTNNGIVGYALDSAVAGDIFTVQVKPGVFQG
jgi:hypothetical protein